MNIKGPCIICGCTNYALSFGGPTICPPCDAGQNSMKTVEQQRSEIAHLRKENDLLRDIIEKRKRGDTIDH